MARHARLHTPGPVEVSPLVQRTLLGPHPHHRTEAFQAVVRALKPLLASFFRTQQPVLVLTSSGTGAMEAAVGNLARPGDRTLSIVSGKFGRRWAQISEALGLDARVLDVEWGHAVDPSDVIRRLDEDRPRLLLATQVETSTGVLHPVRELAEITRRREVMLVVDAVSALGAHPMEMDEWGVDAVVCGSQKVLSLPTGLGLVALGERAQEALSHAAIPRYALDLVRALASWEKDDFPFTPSIPLVTALAASLAEFVAPGLEHRWRQFDVLSRVARGASEDMGFRIFPEAPARSLTTLALPESVDPKAIIRRMEDTFGIRIAGGQEKLKGKIVRLGHMGYYGPADLLAALGALHGSVRAEGLDRPCDLGRWAEVLGDEWPVEPTGPEETAR